MASIFAHYNYVVVIVLMMTGLYVVFASNNMVKKLVGLSVFQTSVFLLYISMGKISGGLPPILVKDDMITEHGDSSGAATHGAAEATSQAHDGMAAIYSNPLPHVLILTAIVVGVATLAIGLALLVRTREAYGTIEETEIDALDYQANLEGVGE
ncbi:MAG TPA: NADH:quinone oxidoreductase [Hellea balneolensis]|uniref:NADH:quinone oxidoreductase n=1 Tax=Hellea balneolensis TaxID=287478 RepID=A0A7C5LYW2_9PROT|nr:NADH:quinone oxidoreductase [Hellea balneolensis]